MVKKIILIALTALFSTTSQSMLESPIKLCKKYEQDIREECLAIPNLDEGMIAIEKALYETFPALNDCYLLLNTITGLKKTSSSDVISYFKSPASCWTDLSENNDFNEEKCLAGLNFQNAYLPNANFKHANLEETDLSYADLSNADFYGTNLQNTDLKYANLKNAKLSFADLENKDLSGVNLEDSNLTFANLENANLENANLLKANLFKANLTKTNLQNANLRDADLQHAKIDTNIFTARDWQYAYLGIKNILKLYSKPKSICLPSYIRNLMILKYSDNVK